MGDESGVFNSRAEYLLKQDLTTAVQDVLAMVTSEKVATQPWRNILNSHTTNRPWDLGGGVNRIVDCLHSRCTAQGWVCALGMHDLFVKGDGLHLQVTIPLAASKKDTEAEACKAFLGHLLVIGVERVHICVKHFMRGHDSIADIRERAGRWNSYLLGHTAQPPPAFGSAATAAAAAASAASAPPPQSVAPEANPPTAAAAAAPPQQPTPQPPPPPGPPPQSAAPAASPPRRPPPPLTCECCNRPPAWHGDPTGTLPLARCASCGLTPSYHYPQCCPWAIPRPKPASQGQQQMHHQAPQAAVGAQQEQQLQLLLFQWGHMQQQQKQQQEQQQQLEDQHWEQVQQQQLLLLQQQQLEQQQMELQEVRAQLEQLGRSPSQPAQPEPLEPMLVHIMTRPDLPAVATTHAQTSAIQLLPAPLALGSTSNVVSAIAPATAGCAANRAAGPWQH